MSAPESAFCLTNVRHRITLMLMGRTLSKKGATPLMCFRIPRGLQDDLRRLAKKDRRNLSDYVRLLLVDHVAAKKRKKRKGGQ